MIPARADELKITAKMERVIRQNHWKKFGKVEDEKRGTHKSYFGGNGMTHRRYSSVSIRRQARANTDDGIAAQRADQPQWR